MDKHKQIARLAIHQPQVIIIIVFVAIINILDIYVKVKV